MPFHKIDTGVKQQALQLIAEGWSLEQVIEAIGVSRRSIDRWMDNYETFGFVVPLAVVNG
jgi:transposase-like protein